MVVKYGAMKNQRNPSVSCDKGVRLETHWGHLPALEHRGEMRICDVDVVNSDAIKNQRNPRVSCDRGLFRRRIWAIFLPKSTDVRCGFVLLMLYITVGWRRADPVLRPATSFAGLKLV